MTVIANVMETNRLTIPELCKRAKIHVTDAYQIRKGSRSAGPSVRKRVAAALGVAEDAIFDKEGWPVSHGA